MIKEPFFRGRRARFFISNSGLVALMGLARPAGMRASRLAPACLSRSRRSRVTDQAPASQRLEHGAARHLLRELPSQRSGDIAAVFIRKAALPPTAEASLRAAQYHLLTVVEKEMFSRWILARGDFGAQRATRARPVGRRVSVLRQSRGGQGLQGAWGGPRRPPGPCPRRRRPKRREA